ncbi:MAG: hypothetical protein FK733_12025 [Asgard group archaeon]|nr:hypothetical protein [Asgard group archaeon]
MLLILFGISIGTGISVKPEIPTLYLTTNDNPIWIEATNIIQLVLAEQLGINVEVRVYPWIQYLYGQLLPGEIFPDITTIPSGEPQWRYSEELGMDLPIGWDMTLVFLAGGGYDPPWFIFNTSSVLNLGGYSNHAYDNLGTQLDALDIDWYAPGGSLETLDPEARDLLFALQIQFYQNPPALNIVSRNPYTGPWGRNWLFLYFNFDNPYLTKQLRRKIRTVIPEEEILLLMPPDQGWGITSTFMSYGNPYLDPKFMLGGVFAP